MTQQAQLSLTIMLVSGVIIFEAFSTAVVIRLVLCANAGFYTASCCDSYRFALNRAKMSLGTWLLSSYMRAKQSCAQMFVANP